MNRPTDTQKQLLELVQMSVGVRDTLSQPPSDDAGWRALAKEVSVHRLMGVTFPVIEQLYNAGVVPAAFYSMWLVMESRIREFNERQSQVSANGYRFFQKNGFRSCILKGQAAAQRYPNPLLRQSGDIDIWVEGERKQVVSFLRKRFSLKKIVYHHCEFDLGNGMEMEVHFTPSWMNGYFANRRLQRWLTSEADEQFSHVDPSLGFAVPTLPFDAVYFLLHIYRHVLEEGVGLRQIYDYYYVLRHLDAAGRERVCRDLKHLGMMRFAGELMYVLQTVFALEDTFLLCPPRPRSGAYLLDSVLRSGNFGEADSRNAHEKGESLVGHGWRKVRRGARLLLHYPSEVLAMPFFMIWQYFWRRRNAYLYHGR
jgi:hypothetical protein